MRPRLAALAFALLSCSGTVGAVSIASDDHPGDCQARVSDACALWVDENASDAVGDDEVGIGLVGAEVRGGEAVAGVSGEVGGNTSDVEVRHPTFGVINGSWGPLNQSRPDLVRDRVEFQTRPRTAPRSSDGVHPWGNFVVLNTPELASAGVGFVSPIAICHWPCQWDWPDGPRSDDESTQPFPNGVAVRDAQGMNSEGSMRDLAGNTEACVDRAVCVPRSNLSRGVADVTLGTAESQLPSLRWGVELDAATLRLDDDPPFNQSIEITTNDENARPPLSSENSVTALRHMPLDGSRQGFPEALVDSSAPRSARSTDAAARGIAGGSQTTGAEFPAAAVAAAVAAIALLILTIATLYARPRSRDDGGTRRRVYEIISAHPGSSTLAIARLAGVARGTARYHIHVLAQSRLVAVESRGGIFASGASSVGPASSTSSSRIVEHLRAFGPRTQSELCHELDLPRSTVSDAVGALGRAALVIAEGRGSQVALVAHGQSPNRNG